MNFVKDKLSIRYQIIKNTIYSFLKVLYKPRKQSGSFITEKIQENNTMVKLK